MTWSVSCLQGFTPTRNRGSEVIPEISKKPFLEAEMKYPLNKGIANFKKWQHVYFNISSWDSFGHIHTFQPWSGFTKMWIPLVFSNHSTAIGSANPTLRSKSQDMPPLQFLPIKNRVPNATDYRCPCYKVRERTVMCLCQAISGPKRDFAQNHPKNMFGLEMFSMNLFLASTLEM